MCSWKFRSLSMPFWENDISSMYTATQVVALYSASISACFRRRACLSASPSRFSNLVGSGRGSEVRLVLEFQPNRRRKTYFAGQPSHTRTSNLPNALKHPFFGPAPLVTPEARPPAGLVRRRCPMGSMAVSGMKVHYCYNP